VREGKGLTVCVGDAWEISGGPDTVRKTNGKKYMFSGGTKGGGNRSAQKNRRDKKRLKRVGARGTKRPNPHKASFQPEEEERRRGKEKKRGILSARLYLTTKRSRSDERKKVGRQK